MKLSITNKRLVGRQSRPLGQWQNIYFMLSLRTFLYHISAAFPFQLSTRAIFFLPPLLLLQHDESSPVDKQIFSHESVYVNIASGYNNNTMSKITTLQ